MITFKDIQSAPPEERSILFFKMKWFFTSKADITATGYLLLGYLPHGKSKKEKYDFIRNELGNRVTPEERVQLV